MGRGVFTMTHAHKSDRKQAISAYYFHPWKFSEMLHESLWPPFLFIYFMWFGAPFVCFQILLVQKQWTWRWLDLPWWALSIPKWEARLNWFRLCQAFEDSWAGNRGNSEFGIRMGEVVPWYLQPFYSHFLAPNFGVKLSVRYMDVSLEATRNGRLLRPWMPSSFAVQHMLPQEAPQLCWPKSSM